VCECECVCVSVSVSVSVSECNASQVAQMRGTAHHREKANDLNQTVCVRERV